MRVECSSTNNYVKKSLSQKVSIIIVFFSLSELLEPNLMSYPVLNVSKCHIALKLYTN